jgi:hypothetical protein
MVSDRQMGTLDYKILFQIIVMFPGTVRSVTEQNMKRTLTTHERGLSLTEHAQFDCCIDREEVVK